MKTTMVIFGCLVFSLVSCAQKTPPKAVADAFSQRFQKAEKVKWDMEEANEWEAEFKLSGKELSASFDLTGKWLETEAEIEATELPEAVKTAVEKQFAGAKIGEASRIESPDFTGFEFELKQKGKEFEVQSTKDGALKVSGESKEKKDKD